MTNPDSQVESPKSREFYASISRPTRSKAHLSGEESRQQDTPNRLTLDRRLHDATINCKTVDDYVRCISRIVSDHSDLLALWICKRGEDGKFNQIHAVSDDNANAVWQLVEEDCRQLISDTAKNGCVTHRPVAGYSTHQLVSAAVHDIHQTEYVLAGCFSAKQQDKNRQLWLMSMVSHSFMNWFQFRKMEQVETKTKSLNDALALIQALDQTNDVQQASMAIVNHLRRFCGSEQVAISICNENGPTELSAISDVEKVEAGSESNKLINHACSQAVTANRILAYPNGDATPDASTLPLEQYCKANRFAGCVNIPLTTHDGRTLGSILFAVPSERSDQQEYIEYLGRLTQMITGHLDVVIRANRGLRDLIKSRIRRLRQTPMLKTTLIAFAVAFVAMCIPWPYRVPCNCEIQPVMRRFVAAPYAGILEKTLVEHGDVVQQGQVLAYMDGRQVRIELAGTKAEYEGARKRRDSALAKRDYATSQIAKSEMNRMQAKIDLLNQRIENLEIKSPIDGIIVKGDLEKVEGAPLELGQTLFEVGPLDQMVAEVAIPEAEIQYVDAGMNVAIKLNAFPFQSWNGQVIDVHPRTEIVNDESVFIAEVKLPNDENLLRPGLKGSAKIRSNVYPIGWNLFHRSWESIRYWLIW